MSSRCVQSTVLKSAEDLMLDAARGVVVSVLDFIRI